MKSIIIRNTTRIEKREPLMQRGKEWVFVTNLNGETRVISFEELFYILRWIGECENVKYPELYHKGASMVADFCREAVLGYSTYDELAKRYKLPFNSPPQSPDQIPMFGDKVEGKR